jgi:hypothetical protein
MNAAPVLYPTPGEVQPTAPFPGPPPAYTSDNTASEKPIQTTRIRSVWNSVCGFFSKTQDQTAMSAKVTYLEAENTRLNGVIAQLGAQIDGQQRDLFQKSDFISRVSGDLYAKDRLLEQQLAQLDAYRGKLETILRGTKETTLQIMAGQIDRQIATNRELTQVLGTQLAVGAEHAAKLAAAQQESVRLTRVIASLEETNKTLVEETKRLLSEQIVRDAKIEELTRELETTKAIPQSKS